MRYVHTNIISYNWQALSEFYIKVFDCKVVPPQRDQSGEWLSKGTGVEDAHLEGVHLLLPGYGDTGPTLEIYSYKTVDQRDPISPNTQGIGHLAFEVDDVQAVLYSLLENGGSKNGEISSRHVPDIGTITFIYARDPDGNLIELQNWDRV